MPNPGDEARRLLLQKERAAALRTIAEFQKIAKRLAAELYDLLARIEKERKTEGNASPSLLLRKARTRDLFEQVNAEIFKLSQRLGIDTSNLQKSAIDIAQKSAGQYAELKSNLTFFDSSSTRELIGIAGDGEPLQKHFESIAEPVRNRMFEALFSGIATGASNASIAKEIKDAVGFGAARALTIARTETNRAYREASRKYYDDSGQAGGWRWVAALDLTTCPICWSLHGRIFKTSEMFATHPNCRCTMVPVFPEDPKAETGPEKFARLTLEQQRTILGPRRLELYNQGAELKHFVERYTSTFGPSRRIRSLEKTTFEPSPRTPADRAFPPRIGPDITPVPALRARTSEPEPAKATTAAIVAGEPVPTLANAKAANEYLSRRFPGTTFDLTGVDFGDGFAQSHVNEIARLLDLYPDVAARLKSYGVARVRADWFAQHSRDARNTESYIQLNADGGKFEDRKSFREKKERNKRTGWSVTDVDQGTTTHEFGHAVDYWLESIRGESLLPWKDANGSTLIDSLKTKITRRLKPKPGEQSDYSFANKREQFAEGFSMMHNRPADEQSRFARALAKLLDRIQDRPRFKSADIPYLSDLSDADARAAKKEINDLYKELGLTPPFKKKEL